MGAWRTSALAMYLSSHHYRLQLAAPTGTPPIPADLSYQKLYIDLLHP